MANGAGKGCQPSLRAPRSKTTPQPFTGSGKPGHADVPFDLGVVRLEVGVGNRPIGEIRAGYGTDLAALNEINLMETPEVCGEVNAGAADEAPIEHGALALGSLVGGFAVCVGLELGMIGE